MDKEKRGAPAPHGAFTESSNSECWVEIIMIIAMI